MAYYDKNVAAMTASTEAVKVALANCKRLFPKFAATADAVAAAFDALLTDTVRALEESE